MSSSATTAGAAVRSAAAGVALSREDRAPGERGYLGSANLTGPGLGEHVKAALPLGAGDVVRVWWLIEGLEKARLQVAG